MGHGQGVPLGWPGRCERDHTVVSASSGAAAYRFYGDGFDRKKGGIGGGPHHGALGCGQEVGGAREAAHLTMNIGGRGEEDGRWRASGASELEPMHVVGGDGGAEAPGHALG